MPLCSPCPQFSASQLLLIHAFLLQVPRIHWELSTKRVLLMEFVDGGQVNDRDYMERNKIDVNEVRSRALGCWRGRRAWLGLLSKDECVQERVPRLGWGLLSKELRSL